MKYRYNTRFNNINKEFKNFIEKLDYNYWEILENIFLATYYGINNDLSIKILYMYSMLSEDKFDVIDYLKTGLNTDSILTHIKFPEEWFYMSREDFELYMKLNKGGI